MPGANENVTDLRGLSINVCVQTVNTSRACLLISSIAVTDIVKLTPIHYTTLHYTTLHYTTLHYTTLISWHRYPNYVTCCNFIQQYQARTT